MTETTRLPPARSGSFLANRNLRGLTVTQFLGAFNDNLFQQVVLFLAARRLFDGDDRQGIAFAVFALPFVLFSGIAGNLSEKVSKRSVIVAMKVAEIAVMALAVLAFAAAHWVLLLTVLFLMGTQSAIFGPSKYGVVPELVDRRSLLAANGIISMTTFLAILSGQALAGPILDEIPDHIWLVGLVCVGIATLGTATATTIERVPPTQPDSRIGRNPFGDLLTTIRELREDRRTFRVVIANSLFWFNGGVLRQAVVGMDDLLEIGAVENTRISILLATLATSLMVSCVLTPQLGKKMPAGSIVRVGVLLLLVGQLPLVLVGSVVPAAEGYWLTFGSLVLIGFGAGMYTVPVVSYIQDAPPDGHKGKTFAVNNFLNFLLIFLAGGYYALTTELEIPPTWATAAAALLLAGFYLLNRRAFAGLELARP